MANLAAAAGSSLGGELSLFTADGHLVFDAPAETIATISQFLLPGDYVLEIRGAQGSTGAFELTTEFVAETAPLDRLPGETVAALADVNLDGHPDLITTIGDAAVLRLARGNGAFAEARKFVIEGLDAPFFGGTVDRSSCSISTKTVCLTWPLLVAIQTAPITQ